MSATGLPRAGEVLPTPARPADVDKAAFAFVICFCLRLVLCPLQSVNVGNYLLNAKCVPMMISMYKGRLCMCLFILVYVCKDEHVLVLIDSYIFGSVSPVALALLYIASALCVSHPACCW
jgi:hypothetical protein